MVARNFVTKKSIFISLVAISLFSLVILSSLALQSNQAKNSRAAAESSQLAKTVTPASPPTAIQQEDITIQFKASINNENKLQLIGSVPQFIGYKLYTIYLQKSDRTFVHLDTFIATQETVNSLFADYWQPKVPLSPNEVKSGIFFLYHTN